METNLNILKKYLKRKLHFEYLVAHAFICLLLTWGEIDHTEFILIVLKLLAFFYYYYSFFFK